MPDAARPDEVTTLPRIRTRLIGRERELATLTGLLQQEDVALVTLIGPGGVGKTQLALAVAAALNDRFPDAIRFVQLAPLNDAALVVPAIASTLGISEQPGQILLNQVISAIGNRRLLLVLDNVEHVIEAATAVGELIAACRELIVLATSRTPLRLHDEREYPLRPLDLPASDSPSSCVDLAAYGATALFVERAARVNPEIATTNDTPAIITEICRRLDGLPLAIELAAARTKMLSPPALLDRLEQRLPLLSGGPRDLPARQRTMRDTIAWSYDLLASDEQRMFRALSAFLGGWTLEAAEAVCGQEELFERLAALVDHSLIRQIEQPDGAIRFGVLETIREFALDQLQAHGEQEEIRERHARYFLALAIEAGQHLMRAGGMEWLRRLDADYSNLRLALDWALDHDVETAVRAAAALWNFWLTHAHFTDGRQVLEAALAADVIVSDPVRASGLDTAASLASWQGDFKRADELFEQSLTIFRTLGDDWNIANTLRGMCRSAMAEGDFERAARIGEESLAIFRTLNDPIGIQGAVGNLGWNALGTGDLERGRAMLEEALALARDLQSTPGIANYTAGLAYNALDTGNLDGATSLFTETVRLCLEIDDTRFIALSFEGFGRIAARRGDLERAARLFGAADGLRTAIGMPVVEAFLGEMLAHDIASVQSRLEADAYQAAWHAGQAMPVADAIAFALDSARPTNVSNDSASSTQTASLGVSARELDVLRLLVNGASNQEIAEALYISPHTVATHVANIMNKLGVESRTAAATYAIRHGLV
ncbi:MAG TPA: LuxR C-terminal-related transcriptional regulator [Thermomicrobiales bacterium]|nr:LuxR C-terminal-related transcriptional regulator [Thermomicrobiales bacterium]